MSKARPRRQPQWFHCPHCGEEVRVGSKACPHCGSDEETGWRADGSEAGFSADSEDDFDYDQYIEREFPHQAGRHSTPKARITWILLALALAGLIASAFMLI